CVSGARRSVNEVATGSNRSQSSSTSDTSTEYAPSSGEASTAGTSPSDPGPAASAIAREDISGCDPAPVSSPSVWDSGVAGTSDDRESVEYGCPVESVSARFPDSPPERCDHGVVPG